MRVRCMTHVWEDRFEYANFCYSDLQALWHHRNLADGALPYVEQFVEYPVLTGLHMWLTAMPVTTDNGFILVNAAVFLVLALGTTWALHRTTGSLSRTLLWAGGTPLVLYAVYNWELLAVAPLAVGMLLWRRGAWAGAGFAFGLGASAKLFPLAALPLGFAWLWQRGRRRDAVRFAAALVGVVAAVNAPFIVASLDGWLETWRFHQDRFPDFGTLWYWTWEAAGQPDWDAFRRLADAVGLAAMGLGTVGVLVLQWRRRLPMEAAMGVLVALFLVVTKVHSPQYALWLLPFLVLAPGGGVDRAGGIDRAQQLALAYMAVDLTLFVSGYLWIASDAFPGPHPLRAVFAASVVARALLLVAVGAYLGRADGDVAAVQPAYR